MEPDLIEASTISRLRDLNSSTSRAIAGDLVKFNQIYGIDPEMAIVRARRVVDLIVRNAAISASIIPGTKPLDQLLTELNKAKSLPVKIQKHCHVVKEFGNIAAHGLAEGSADDESNGIGSVEVSICSTSVKAVVLWYLEQGVPQRPTEIEFRIVSGADVTEEMILQAIEIDRMCYPEEMQGIPETCFSWHRQNPDIYTMLLDSGTNHVVGCINAMPLEQRAFKMIESGDIIDMSISSDMIRKYDLPDFYLLYFSSIVIHPSYRNSSTFRILYNAFIEKLLLLARQEIFIKEILADAVTDDGVKLCEYAGMKHLGDSGHGSRIYRTTMIPPGLRATTVAGKNLLTFYQNKYEEFKDLLPSL